MSAAFNLPKLSTLLRDIHSQPEPGCRYGHALLPAAIHKESLLVRGESAERSQRCDSKRILATPSQELATVLGLHFKSTLEAPLGEATQ